MNYFYGEVQMYAQRYGMVLTLEVEVYKSVVFQLLAACEAMIQKLT